MAQQLKAYEIELQGAHKLLQGQVDLTDYQRKEIKALKEETVEQARTIRVQQAQIQDLKDTLERYQDEALEVEVTADGLPVPSDSETDVTTPEA